jgi:hypothetical protein
VKRDFTLHVFQEILRVFLSSGYGFQTFAAFLEKPERKVVLMRHDVDKRPRNARAMAEIEHNLGIQTSYYFRILPKFFDRSVIRDIAAMGHEIGYHYEDLTLAAGDRDRAARLFESHLEEFRRIVPVKTICMHGSPLSRWDNRLIWETIDYHDYGIMGEPYLDLDFDEVLYLSDTGRRWNGGSVSIRDKVNSHYQIDIRTTVQLMTSLGNGCLPDRLMFNIHPQRWEDRWPGWCREYIFQWAKNLAKTGLVRLRPTGPQANV